MTYLETSALSGLNVKDSFEDITLLIIQDQLKAKEETPAEVSNKE